MIDLEGFKADTMDALERAGFPSAAHTLACNSWPIKVWPELVASQDDPDSDQRARVVKARDHLVALLDLYGVSFEWDADGQRWKVMGKGGQEVGCSIVMPKCLRSELGKRLDEEKSTW